MPARYAACGEKPETGRKASLAVAEGHIPASSTRAGRELRSHETACILNAGERDAHLHITLFSRRYDELGVPAGKELALLTTTAYAES